MAVLRSMLVEASKVFVNPASAVMPAPDGAPHEPAIYRAPRHDDPPDMPNPCPSGPRAVMKIIFGIAEGARLHIQPITSKERSRRSEYSRAAAPATATPKGNFRQLILEGQGDKLQPNSAIKIDRRDVG